MTKLDWTPWHQVVELRDDLKSGELSLSIFAADLYDVVMGRAKPVYQDADEFFALTYPTFNLRELSKDVALRLANKNDKAVRQLTLTYGGGKTHALILLYHLFKDGGKLPDVASVREIRNHIGIDMPRARVAVLAFDKIDVESGMDIVGPDGSQRRLRQPWSILAYQIAGDEGLKILHPDGKAEERNSAPAEPLLADVLRIPLQQKLPTLILIDEVLMYAREKVRLDKGAADTLTNFFQYLTQAATKIDGCTLVASLLASDPAKNDSIGKQLTADFHTIFRREQEEGVQPVTKEDVPEVLRRRFFKPHSIEKPELFREHVVAALKGIASLDEQTARDLKGAEDRYINSYPFHPDLTEVLYSKWTALEGFQRTRGVLRTFSLALRSACKWDTAPLISAGVFLGAPSQAVISEAATELISVAGAEEYEGKTQNWRAILEGEIEKARHVQEEFSSLKHRECEAAVFATFLHSQPAGQKASTRELMLLLGHTRPDKIDIEKALKRWSEESWWLDDEAIEDAEVGPDGQKMLPKSWMLGIRPNLKQMHNAEWHRIDDVVVEQRLDEEIRSLKKLTEGASAAGARVHMLPDRPRDIEDDGDFHFAVLGIKAASQPGRPSADAKRFINETSGPDRPRVYRNAIVLAVPSLDGVDAARSAIKDYLAWSAVQSSLSGKNIDPIRRATLQKHVDDGKKRIPGVIRQAYCVAVTVSEKNEIEAFKVSVGDDPLFTTIKADSNSRIQETAITAEALLPGGPYDLWREDETSRRVKDLVGAFAQFPRLPKMLNRKAILDTLVNGCKSGTFVLVHVRPDQSRRTFWREPIDDAVLSDPALEVMLPEAASLDSLSYTLLAPNVLPSLWNSDTICLTDLRNYFSGSFTARVLVDNYEEPVRIPKVDDPVITGAVQEAVKNGLLWLTDGPASLLDEEVPTGYPTESSVLQAPPDPIPPLDIIPDNLPNAWSDNASTALTVASALSSVRGKTLPWVTVRRAIDDALKMRLVERGEDSGPWPCEFPEASKVTLQIPSQVVPPVEPPVPPPPPVAPGTLVAQAELRPDEIQNMAESMGDLLKAAAGLKLKFSLRIELSGDGEIGNETAGKVNDVLAEVADGLRLE